MAARISLIPLCMPLEEWMWRRSAYRSRPRTASAPPLVLANCCSTEDARVWRASNTARIVLSESVSPSSWAASIAIRRSRMACASCSKEKKMAERVPAETARRSICRAIVVLPSPCGPPIRTSSPERNPPPRAVSRESKPVGQTIAPAERPCWILWVVSARTPVSDFRRGSAGWCEEESPSASRPAWSDDDTVAVMGEFDHHPAGARRVSREMCPNGPCANRTKGTKLPGPDPPPGPQSALVFSRERDPRAEDAQGGADVDEVEQHLHRDHQTGRRLRSVDVAETHGGGRRHREVQRVGAVGQPGELVRCGVRGDRVEECEAEDEQIERHQQLLDPVVLGGLPLPAAPGRPAQEDQQHPPGDDGPDQATDGDGITPRRLQGNQVVADGEEHQHDGGVPQQHHQRLTPLLERHGPVRLSPVVPVRGRCRRTWSRGTPRCPRNLPRGRSPRP